MKIKYSLYSIAALSVGILLAGIVSYTTDTLHSNTTKKQPLMKQTATPTKAVTLTVEKKNCGCCTERMARLQEQIRKARERKRAAQRAEAKVLVERQKSEYVSNSQ
ncbi:hypothetical protein C6496_11910 [Candidatus Poribacteria bacterium]|nr:MAG: hypothetical protein C6496_11910 [Candidatus Poribacteria bacterium]